MIVHPILFALLAACGSSEPPAPVPEPVPERPPEFTEDASLDGLQVNLRSVRDGATGTDPGAPPAPPTPPQPLDAAAVEALLSQAPPVSGGEAVDFRVRAGSPPPPLPGEDIVEAFPSRGSEAPDVATGPLRVLRFAPEGEVPLAPRVSVTFDQPMIPLTTQDEAAKTVPVTLDPQPEGAWRWLGTRTVVFDPVERLPMATDYTVTVAPEVTSLAGNPLEGDASFTFSTPAPSVTDSWPYRDSLPLQPVIGLVFDQAVDDATVLAHVALSGGHELRLATDAEIAEDPEQIGGTDVPEERVVRLVPEGPLPPKSELTLTVPPGLVGLEGPRPSTESYTVELRTYHPLSVREHGCSWDDVCPPSNPWYVQMNNALDPEQDLSGVTVEPEVPGLSVVTSGRQLSVTGAFDARTRYRLTLPATLSDTHGQRLGDEETLRFDTGPARPSFDASGGSFVVLDPNGGGRWPVFSTNHRKLKATVHRVAPEDWSAWRTFRDEHRYDDDRPGRLPGDSVLDEVVAIEDRPDELVETAVDLSPHLQEGYGQFVAMVQPQPQPRNRWERTYELAWVQVTRLGLHAFVDGDEVRTWVTDLATGEPLPGVTVELLPSGRQAKTDADGLVSLPLEDGEDASMAVVARRGDDTAILPAAPEWSSGGWVRASDEASIRWFVADDRGLYKPGETAHIKGWLRAVGPGPEGDIERLDDPPSVRWSLVGARGNELGKGTAEVSEQGGFDLTLDIPVDANLGDAWLSLTTDTSSHTHRLPIQEFRRPEVEVSAEADRDRFVLGEEAQVEVSARYFTGGALPDTPVTWTVRAADTSWRPPGHQGFTFGGWSPRWWSWHGPTDTGSDHGPWTIKDRTAPDGTARLGVHVEAMGPPRPRTLTVEGQIVDVNRQAWTASDTVVVHPAAVAVGLQTERSFVEPDEPMSVSMVVVDLDGTAQADRPVVAVLERLSGYWDAEAEALDTCEATSDAEGLAACTFTVVTGGSYRVRAEARDALGRPSSSDLRFWVSGAERVPSRRVELESVQLIPETDDLAPGDTARVLVSAPFSPSEAVISWRRSGLLHTERRHLDGGTTTVELPITDGLTPDVTLQVDVVGQAARTDDDGNVLPDAPKRVAHATGALSLRVSPVRRTLEVSVAPAAEAVAPGRDTELSVRVVDARGKPVRDAEVALIVVDEAVLSLTNYQLPNPLDVFYAARGAGVSDHRLRGWVALADPTQAVEAPQLEITEEEGNFGYGGGGLKSADGWLDEDKSGEMPKERVRFAERGLLDEASTRVRASLSAVSTGMQAGGAGMVAVREDFGATALFAPSVRTDADGHATVPFSLPDSLTRYRVMAVAVHDVGFGQGEASLTARLPLMVRPSLPRFLNTGDQAELPVVLENQTDGALDVQVAMGVANLQLIDALTPTLRPPGSPQGGWSVTVPARDRVEVRFPASTAAAGTAAVQVVARAGRHRDAARIELPVYTPATAEAFATTGSLTDRGLKQRVSIPDDVWKDFGGLEVTTSSTQLQALTDAVIYLESYPFECNEQLASRVLSIASLRDVLSAFEADGLPEPEALEARVQADLDRLVRRQHRNGGFAFWRRGDTPWPWLTIHVAHAFAEAKEAGFVVDERAWSSVASHLRRIESHIPGWYGERERRLLRAYALDVRRRMGDADVGKARRLLAEAGLDEHGLDALGFLLPTLAEGGRRSDVDRILRHLGNRATETTAGAHFTTSYGQGEHVLLHSDRRTDAVVLRALLEVAPDDELLDKVTADLLAHRTAGRWSSTQENAFVLLALRGYFEVREKETPDFVARVWLGDGLVGEHPFQGRTTERYHVEVPMDRLEDEHTLTLLRDGDAGRMFYRMALRYAPGSLELDPADRGFVVERTYEAIDDPGDVRQEEDGTWVIRSGAAVRVTVSMVAESRRYHVALIDPLPAGLEASNPSLATTGTLPDNPESTGRGGWWWWNRTWYEHDNLRDERVEAFTSLLWPGVHEYTYVARATTPGRYVVPPARAEEMYRPETFGRSGTARVVVE